MSAFHYQQDTLYIENVSCEEIAATYGTPSYIYSHAMLKNNWQQFDAAFAKLKHRICYAVKANSNLAILNLFAKLGSGFDIVSGGELDRVIAAGGDPSKIVFSGVAKKKTEIHKALDYQIDCFNIESEAELYRIHTIAAEKNCIAPIGLRINPDIDAKTHHHIATGRKENKFGLPAEDVMRIIATISSLPHVKLKGIGCHIGSQLTSLDPFIFACRRMLEFIKEINEMNKINKTTHHITHLDLGGGLGVPYHQENPPTVIDYANALCTELKNVPLTILLEPGRILVANTGILLTQVEYIKKTTKKNFAIVDAGMNDFVRPALYDAWHAISVVTHNPSLSEERYDVAGPVCESADFLGKDRLLRLEENTILAIHHAGAYGFSMSSHYNSRPRAAEILVNNQQHFLIRARETFADLTAGERIPSSFENSSNEITDY